MWSEKQTFYNKKLDDAAAALKDMNSRYKASQSSLEAAKAEASGANVENKGEEGGSPGKKESFDALETKGQLVVLKKQNAALKIEVKAIQMELRSKTIVEDQKSKLIDLLDRKVNQLKEQNKKLLEKQISGETGASKEGEKKSEDSTDGQNTAASNDELLSAQKTIKELSEKLLYSEKYGERLKNANSELKAMLSDLEQKGVKLMDLAKTKVKSYSEENKQLKSDMGDLSTKVSEGEAQVKEVQSRLNAAEKEKDHIVSDKKNLEEKLDLLTDSIVNKEETNIEIMNEVLKIRDSLAKTEEDRVHREFHEKLNNLETENKDLVEALNRTKEDYEQLLSEKKVLDEQMRSLKAVLNPGAPLGGSADEVKP